MAETLSAAKILKPVEKAIIEPGFDWTKEAWFEGQVHPISRLTDQTEWIHKKLNIQSFREPPILGFVYQITPFVFQDEAATEATGAHFIIPEAKYMNTVLFTDPDYYWRARVVDGAGWLIAWHPETGVQRIWLGSSVGPSPVFEFSQNWLVRFVAAEGYGQLILEGVDRPEYRADGEKVIEENTPSIELFYKGQNRIFDLTEFWK